MLHGLLLHCYRYNYPSTKVDIDGIPEPSYVNELDTNSLMYALVDKYRMQGLRKEAF